MLCIIPLAPRCYSQGRRPWQLHYTSALSIYVHLCPSHATTITTTTTTTLLGQRILLDLSCGASRIDRASRNHKPESHTGNTSRISSTDPKGQLNLLRCAAHNPLSPDSRSGHTLLQSRPACDTNVYTLRKNHCQLMVWGFTRQRQPQDNDSS